MGLLGNLIWLIFGGLFSAIGWWLVGALWCMTIIGIPVGVQCFKMAKISLAPFGKQIILGEGAGSLLLNIIWWFFGGIELAVAHALWGAVLCLTIIGIPFGKQFFKLAKLTLLPFGAQVMPYDGVYMEVQ